MKKNLMIAALVAIMVVASSAVGKRSPRIVPGEQSPELVLDGTDHSVALSDYRGSYVLLSFWASTDAPSRVAVNNYDTALRHRGGNTSKNDIVHLSVNFDTSKDLFEAIVKADNLDASTQFNASGNFAKSIIGNFDLEHGYGSLLIDPYGKIIAVNPEISNLTAI